MTVLLFFTHWNCPFHKQRYRRTINESLINNAWSRRSTVRLYPHHTTFHFVNIVIFEVHILARHTGVNKTIVRILPDELDECPIAWGEFAHLKTRV